MSIPNNNIDCKGNGFCWKNTIKQFNTNINTQHPIPNTQYPIPNTQYPIPLPCFAAEQIVFTCNERQSQEYYLLDISR